MKPYPPTQFRISHVMNGKACLAFVVGAAGVVLSVENIHAQELLERPLYVPKIGSKPSPRPSDTVSPPPSVLAEPAAAVVTPPGDSTALTRVRKNEVSFSTDFMLGQGEVTVPIGYSVREALGEDKGVPVGGQLVKRDSIYFGGTISYSYGQKWYLDLSYSQGDSSGNVSFNAFEPRSDFKADFTIEDQWHQAYVRYAFDPLAGKPVYIYLRAGATYVTADLTLVSVDQGAGRYRQDDSTRDILGNIGFGVRYTPYATRSMNIGLNVEGEGFYGFRTQESRETLEASEGLATPTATIDNTLYGGIGRVTARFEYAFGQARALRAFAEAGLQARFTIINYPGSGSENEILWGPYAKLGLRYRF